MTEPLLLRSEEVEALLPMAECIEVVADALASLARGEAVVPLRSVVWHPDRHGLIGTMPGFFPVPGTAGVLGLKVVTVFPGNHALGLESHLGSILLFEGKHGHPIAIFPAAIFTAIRTAAVSAVATRLLAR
ncbi:MAG TPA: ornithine cyclodeaminase family protein, partial [Thermoanaerobaculia bacterium]